MGTKGKFVNSVRSMAALAGLFNIVSGDPFQGRIVKLVDLLRFQKIVEVRLMRGNGQAAILGACQFL